MGNKMRNGKVSTSKCTFSKGDGEVKIIKREGWGEVYGDDELTVEVGDKGSIL